MSIIRFLLSLFKRQPYEDCCPHILCPDEVEEPDHFYNGLPGTLRE